MHYIYFICDILDHENEPFNLAFNKKSLTNFETFLILITHKIFLLSTFLFVFIFIFVYLFIYLFIACEIRKHYL